MTIVQFPKTHKTDENLWDEYVHLSKKAQMTMDIKDGLKARRAYQAFMESQNGN